MKKITLLWLVIVWLVSPDQNLLSARKSRIRQLGITIGILEPGPLNAITDVAGVKVGHLTLIESDHIRTGVTAILPHGGNLFSEKVPGAIYIANGFGKLTGYSQVKELGTIETPIILTNTLSVPDAAAGLLDYMLSLKGNGAVRSINPLVGETNDGWLNDIRGRHVKPEHIGRAIGQATSGPVAEGSVGAGTGTVCFGFKGGIGTASRLLPDSMGGYTVGVLVQSNFGGILQVAGCPIGVLLDRYSFRRQLNGGADGSCMIVLATDAPLDARNLERLAKRAILGLGRTGGICSNGSGDYVIAFSTATDLVKRFPPGKPGETGQVPSLANERMSPLFLAAVETTEEAILNSLFMATSITGIDGRRIEELPVGKVKRLLASHRVIK